MLLHFPSWHLLGHTKYFNKNNDLSKSKCESICIKTKVENSKIKMFYNRRRSFKIYCLFYFYILTLFFSAAKAALGMQMSVNPSVRLSVCPSITPIFLSDLQVYFILANQIKWNLGNLLRISSHLTFRSTHVL